MNNLIIYFNAIKILTRYFYVINYDREKRLIKTTLRYVQDEKLEYCYEIILFGLIK